MNSNTPPTLAQNSGAEKSICHRAHDGWERQFNEINILKGVVSATCAVSDYMLRETAGH